MLLPMIFGVLIGIFSMLTLIYLDLNKLVDLVRGSKNKNKNNQDEEKSFEK